MAIGKGLVDYYNMSVVGDICLKASTSYLISNSNEIVCVFGGDIIVDEVGKILTNFKVVNESYYREFPEEFI